MLPQDACQVSLKGSLWDVHQFSPERSLQGVGSNNFMKFKEALSKKALEEYGKLGKLIKKREIEEPIKLDRSSYKIHNVFNRAAHLKEMKPYCHDKADIKDDQPKHYALILKYLSGKSLEAVQKGDH